MDSFTGDNHNFHQENACLYENRPFRVILSFHLLFHDNPMFAETDSMVLIFFGKVMSALLTQGRFP